MHDHHHNNQTNATTTAWQYYHILQNSRTIKQTMVDINDHFISIISAPLKVDGDGSYAKPVPTHHNIYTSSLTSEGLQAIKKRDPFLYYSIPGIRAAARPNEKVDMSSMKTTQSSISVERRSCVSVEVDILDSLISKGDDKGKRESTNTKTQDWSESEGDNNVPLHTKRRRRWSYTYGSEFQKAS